MIHRTHGRMVACGVLLALNLAFIWGNSLLSAQVSDMLSRWVSTLLGALGGTGFQTGQGHGLLRKLAHFAEFACLGVLLGWLFAMLTEKPWRYLLPGMGCGLLAACLDEMLQQFSPGRAPGLGDVLIDLTGVLLGLALLGTGLQIRMKQSMNKWRKQQ